MGTHKLKCLKATCTSQNVLRPTLIYMLGWSLFVVKITLTFRLPSYLLWHRLPRRGVVTWGVVTVQNMLLLLEAMNFYIYTQNLMGNITLLSIIISVASVN